MPGYMVAWNLRYNEEAGKVKFCRSAFHLNCLLWHAASLPICFSVRASQVSLVVKNPPASAGDVRDVGSVPGSGRSPGGGNSSPLLYSCLENPRHRGAWWATVCEVTKNRIWLKQLLGIIWGFFWTPEVLLENGFSLWLSLHLCLDFCPEITRIHTKQFQLYVLPFSGVFLPVLSSSQ